MIRGLPGLALRMVSRLYAKTATSVGKLEWIFAIRPVGMKGAEAISTILQNERSLSETSDEVGESTEGVLNKFRETGPVSLFIFNRFPVVRGNKV